MEGVAAVVDSSFVLVALVATETVEVASTVAVTVVANSGDSVEVGGSTTFASVEDASEDLVVIVVVLTALPGTLVVAMTELLVLKSIPPGPLFSGKYSDGTSSKVLTRTSKPSFSIPRYNSLQNSCLYFISRSVGPSSSCCCCPSSLLKVFTNPVKSTSTVFFFLASFAETCSARMDENLPMENPGPSMCVVSSSSKSESSSLLISPSSFGSSQQLASIPKIS
mmetsp:Transcript_23629/g.48240  ORF Transcript_23629/g.48240 Transcript_23629/m.48240 type:complete len:223 (-) Transcript_23629:285-953(-)